MRGHPFVRYTAGLVAGILLYTFGPGGYEVPLTALVIGTGLLGWGYLRYRNQPLKPVQAAQGIGALALLLTLGWTITYQRTASNQLDNLVHSADTLRAYEGVVATQPEERAKTYRVELEIRRGDFTRSVTSSALPAPPNWQPVRGRVIVYLD